MFYKFKLVGYCRNDNFNKTISKDIETYFRGLVDYEVKHFILFVPTHRDYEQNLSKVNSNRSILGFNVSKGKMESFLRENGYVIICKLHPKQNKLIIDTELPKGMINFKGSEDFGLTELMILCDGMITDYTSAYFDYLCLDKPVLFNFYDFERYKNTRGFTFDPLYPIVAGGVFTDEKSFFEEMENFLKDDKYAEKRRFVKELLTKHDEGACQRTYSLVKECLDK